MLTIENSEEARVAREAIEEYRKTQIRHVGIFASRMNSPCEQTVRERAFAEKWAEENSRTYNHGILELLLRRSADPREASLAATVIQWLGTHVGWSFVCECIKAAGYSEPRKIDGRGV